jgi:hypothetical protein
MGIEKKGKGRLQIERSCPRLHELKRQIHHQKNQYSLNMLAKSKNREMRRLLTDQFVGMGIADGTLTVGSNVDAITGATVSTRGVTAGVNTAIAVINSMIG